MKGQGIVEIGCLVWVYWYIHTPPQVILSGGVELLSYQGHTLVVNNKHNLKNDPGSINRPYVYVVSR